LLRCNAAAAADRVEQLRQRGVGIERQRLRRAGLAGTLDQIRAVPKVLLHDHLDGGLRPETIVELAAETGVSVNTLLSRKRYAVLHLRQRLQSIYEEFMKA